MSIKYDKLLSLLKDNGYTSYKIKKEGIIGQGTLTALKRGTGGLDSKTLSKLCKLLQCQPGDIMEYVPDNETIERDTGNNSTDTQIQKNNTENTKAETIPSETIPSNSKRSLDDVDKFLRERAEKGYS